jgi:hypothetical protein
LSLYQGSDSTTAAVISKLVIADPIERLTRTRAETGNAVIHNHLALHAKKIMISIRSELRNPVELQAFEQALECTVQDLKQKDELSGKKLDRKTKSRLWRALRTLMDLTQFQNRYFKPQIENIMPFSRASESHPSAISLSVKMEVEPTDELECLFKAETSTSQSTKHTQISAEGQHMAHGNGIGPWQFTERLTPRLSPSHSPIKIKEESMLLDHDEFGARRELQHAQDAV